MGGSYRISFNLESEKEILKEDVHVMTSLHHRSALAVQLTVTGGTGQSVTRLLQNWNRLIGSGILPFLLFLGGLVFLNGAPWESESRCGWKKLERASYGGVQTPTRYKQTEKKKKATVSRWFHFHSLNASL